MFEILGAPHIWKSEVIKGISYLELGILLFRGNYFYFKIRLNSVTFTSM